MADADKLRGWGEIERYLGLTRNTVLAREFPVYKNGGVFAFKAELDAHERRRARPVVRGGRGAPPDSRTAVRHEGGRP